jgi:hypothetical protein
MKEFYTEREVAETLGLSIPLLHMILDENIFNDGTPRPEKLEFTSSDLLLIEFWHKTMPASKVLRMPRRNN